MKNFLYLFLLLILCASCTVPQTSDPSKVAEPVEVEDDPSGSVDMKMVSSDINSRVFVPVKLNKEGIGSIPFSNPSGKLLFKYIKNKIYVDKDDDGKFEGDDATPIDKKEVISVPLKINGKEYDYKLKVPFGQPKVIYLSSLSLLEGDYKGSKISLIDRNINGDFSEVGVDMINFGTASKPGVIGDSFRIGTALFDLRFKDKGTCIVLKPYGGPIGNVRVTESAKRMTRLTVQHEKSKFTTDLLPGEETFLIPGNYKIIRSVSYTVDEHENNKQRDILYGRGGILKIIEGENVINPESDFELEFDAYKSAADHNAIKIRSVFLKDIMGAKYSARLSGYESKPKLQSFIRSGNKEKLLSTMEYG